MQQPSILRTFLAIAVLAIGFAGAQPLLIDSVNDLLEAFRNGGEYQIVPRTYQVSEPLVANGNVRIVGTGRDGVLLELNAGPIGVRVGEGASLYMEGLRMVWAGDGPSDLIVVRNGSLTLVSVDLGFAEAGTIPEADPWRPGGHGSALVLQGSAEVEAHDVVFARNSGNTIEVLDNSYLRLMTPQVIDGFRGLVASGHASVEVGGGVFLDQMAQGVALIGEAQAAFVQTAFSGNGVLNVENDQYLESILVGDSASASFTGGVLRNAPATGLGVSGEASVVVTDMRFEDNGANLEDIRRSWQAVFVSGSGQLAISHSSVTGSPGGAFSVRQNGTLVLDEVEVSGNGGFAHTAVSDQGTLAIQGGRFVGNAGAVVATGNARLGLYDVELRDGGQHGLVLSERASGDIEGGVVVGNADRGVWVDGGASIDARGLRVEGNMMGLFLTGESTAFVSDLVVTGNRHSGVVASGTSRMVIETSEVAQNLSNGVALIESAQAIVRDSALNANGTNGVLVGGKASVTLERNTISGSEAGVRLEAEGVAQGRDNTFVDVGTDVDDVR